MIWALPLGMAALGYLQGEKKRKQELAMAMGNAEANRYSPWTGMHNKVDGPSSDGMSSALQGGLSGAMLMQGWKGGGTEAAAAPAAAASESATPVMQDSPLGSKGMVSDLDQYKNMQLDSINPQAQAPQQAIFDDQATPKSYASTSRYYGGRKHSPWGL